MSEPVVGIEGLQALLAAINTLGLDLVKALKMKTGLVSEGVALVDALLVDESFKKNIGVVVSKFGELPAEVKDLSADEVVALVSAEVLLVPQVISALKA